MRIEYYKENEDEFTERTLEPYKLVNGQEGWYIHSWDLEKDAPRSYRLDRVREVEVTGDRFEPRPGVALALQHHVRPDRVATVFAGADVEATESARSYFTGYGPSSPSIGLLRKGQLVWMLERRQIENQGPDQIAAMLTAAFDRFCTPAAQ